MRKDQPLAGSQRGAAISSKYASKVDLWANMGKSPSTLIVSNFNQLSHFAKDAV